VVCDEHMEEGKETTCMQVLNVCPPSLFFPHETFHATSFYRVSRHLPLS
jgi:hypothetical protein